MVAARSRGLDAERALRTTLRSLTAEIQAAEIPAAETQGAEPRAGDSGIDADDAVPGAGRTA